MSLLHREREAAHLSVGLGVADWACVCRVMVHPVTFSQLAACSRQDLLWQVVEAS